MGNLKTILLPKFVDHVIQTPKFRIVSHIDGVFSIEQKLENQKQYSNVSIQYLSSQRYEEYNSTDRSFIKLLNLIFSSKHFIASILNHQNYIFMIFHAGQISICGKTGKISICLQRTTNHFISRNVTYFMAFFETNNNFAIYHLPSGEIFYFQNSCLKSILLNPNSKVDYDFLKNNGKSSGLVDSKDSLFNQMMMHICKIKVNYLKAKSI